MCKSQENKKKPVQPDFIELLETIGFWGKFCDFKNLRNVVTSSN